MALPRRTSNYYDLIVLGSQLAGLVAAASMAVRGKRVLVLPSGPIEGHYQAGPWSFALDPTPVIAMQGVVLRPFAESLGIWTQLRRDYPSQSDRVHWIGAGRRLNIQGASRRDEMEAQWIQSLREYGEGPELLGALRGRNDLASRSEEILDEVLRSDAVLNLDGFASKRLQTRMQEGAPLRSHDCLPGLASEHPLQWTTYGLAPFFQSLAKGGQSLSIALRQWHQWHQGRGELLGSEVALRRALLSKISLKSGEIRPHLRVGSIVSKRNRLQGVSILGKPDLYGCQSLLIADHPQRFLQSELCPAELQEGPEMMPAYRAVARRFVLHLELDPRGLPYNFGNYAVVAAPAKDSELGAFFLSRNSAQLPDSVRLSVVSTLDPNMALHQAREFILRELEERAILPFFRRYLRMCHSPHDGLPPTDADGRVLTADKKQLHPPLPCSELLQREDSEESGLGSTLVPLTAALRGLFFASDHSYPGLGREGQVLAGLAVAQANMALTERFSASLRGKIA